MLAGVGYDSTESKKKLPNISCFGHNSIKFPLLNASK